MGVLHPESPHSQQLQGLNYVPVKAEEGRRSAPGVKMLEGVVSDMPRGVKEVQESDMKQNDEIHKKLQRLGGR